MFVGSILGLGLSPHMIAALGWPSVFYIFGSFGIVWFGVWRVLAASTPRDDPDISKEEKVRPRVCSQEGVPASWLCHKGAVPASNRRQGCS
jgi:MFS family permease